MLSEAKHLNLKYGFAHCVCDNNQRNSCITFRSYTATGLVAS